MRQVRFGYISALLVGVSLSAFGQGGVEGLPDSFHEYVELTTRNGTQHYFDIDYRPTGNTVVEMAFMPRNLRTPFALFCARLQATTNTYTAIYGGDLVDYAPHRDAIRADYGSASSFPYVSLASCRDPDEGAVLFLKMSSTGCWVDGKRLATWKRADFTADGKLIIGSLYKENMFENLTYGADMRLYSFRVREGEAGHLVRDLVPARMEDACGLWDRVSGRFFHATIVSHHQYMTGEVTVGDTVQDESLFEQVQVYSPASEKTRWVVGGQNAHEGYTVTNLFDGVTATSDARDSSHCRWLGHESSMVWVEIDPSFFTGTSRRGILTGYTLHKIPFQGSVGVNSRAPISWRIEGVRAESEENDWQEIDVQTDVVWPGTYSYSPSGESAPPLADCRYTVVLPDAKRAAYRALRFVPTDSYWKRQNWGEICYGLYELDWRVVNGAPVQDAQTLKIVDAFSQYYEEGLLPNTRTNLTLAAGETVSCTASTTLNGEKYLLSSTQAQPWRCSGWRLQAWSAMCDAWQTVDSGTNALLVYRHPTPAAVRRLVWTWEREPSPALRELHADVVEEKPSWWTTEGGEHDDATYGAARLFDGFLGVNSGVGPYGDDEDGISRRWLAAAGAEPTVTVHADYFKKHDGILNQYMLVKVPYDGTGCNSRTPTAWRLLGVPLRAASDEDWVEIDARTGVVWPGVSYGEGHNYRSEKAVPNAQRGLVFTIPENRRRAYRRLKFVPQTSQWQNAGQDPKYVFGLMEVVFFVGSRPASGGTTVIVR